MCALSSVSMLHFSSVTSFAPALARAPIDWQLQHEAGQTEGKDEWRENRQIRAEYTGIHPEPRPLIHFVVVQCRSSVILKGLIGSFQVEEETRHQNVKRIFFCFFFNGKAYSSSWRKGYPPTVKQQSLDCRSCTVLVHDPSLWHCMRREEIQEGSRSSAWSLRSEQQLLESSWKRDGGNEWRTWERCNKTKMKICCLISFTPGKHKSQYFINVWRCSPTQTTSMFSNSWNLSCLNDLHIRLH